MNKENVEITFLRKNFMMKLIH